MRFPQTVLLLCLISLAPEERQETKIDTPTLAEPDFFGFDELVTLSNADNLSPELEAKLTKILETPTVHNQTPAIRAQPKRRADEGIGPAVRVGFWNIERALQFELIKQVLVEPGKFEGALDAGKKRSPSRLVRIREQAKLLRGVDILVLNEVDLGIKRTDYRDIARELAGALGMNYVYGVEFVEVDGLEGLGTETSHLESPELADRMDADLKPDRALYRGFHGNAILSRYPIRQAKIYRLPVCHDWYADEKKEISKLEQGKRLGVNKLFLERIEREIRRGNRMALVADIDLPESPTGTATIVDTHLENKCKPSCRRKQMAALLEQLQDIRNPVILAGDMNTTGKDGSPTSVRAELMRLVKDYQFWVKQAVNWFTPMTLPTYAVMPFKFWRTYRDPTVAHIPILGSNPEAALFRDLRKFQFDDGNAFDFRGLPTHNSARQSGTLANSNQRARKGFAPTFAMPRDFGGVVRLKLDWFFVKPLTAPSTGKHKEYQFDPYFPRSMQELNESIPDRLSDHAPMTVDLPILALQARAHP